MVYSNSRGLKLSLISFIRVEPSPSTLPRIYWAIFPEGLQMSVAIDAPSTTRLAAFAMSATM